MNDNNIKGRIISVKRFEIHDGDGVRTTLFLKGCPLSCRWCHNPESISPIPVLGFYPSACRGCGDCVTACPKGLHSFDGEKHVFDRTGCISCGACADVCSASALVTYGREVTVDEILPELLYDKPFYDQSGGGVTLSGGEPLSQSKFCRELLKKLKENGVSTAVDTCGYAPRAAVDDVIPYTDTFLYDLKAANPDVHKSITGRDNTQILENLRYIDSLGKRIEIRIPFVPGYNDGEIDGIADIIAGLSSVVKIKVLPYHSYAEDKYPAIGAAKDFCSVTAPTPEQVEQVREILRKRIDKVTVL